MIANDSLQTRALLYGLLARLYSYPLDEQLLEAVAALNLHNAPPGLEGALGQMREAATSSMHVGVEALNVEATRLFEGPGKPVAPPYASYYLYGRLMGPPAIAAYRFYLSREVLPDSDGTVPYDHVAVEMGFMAYLAARTERAQAEGNALGAISTLESSKAFIDEHLISWLPHFIEDAVRRANNPFFTGLAQFTLALINWDRQWLEALEIKHLERSI